MPDLTMEKLQNRFLLWAVSILLCVLSFIGALGVNALVSMSKDIRDIKITVASESVRREAIEKRLDVVEKIVSEK